MLAQQAFFLAALVCVPSMMYLLYRAIVPYEPAMPDFRLAGALFYPGILGFALGLVHIGLDPDLIAGGYGALAFMVLYPAIEAYAVVVVFNRTFFFKQPAAPLYFAVGGASLAFGLGFIETFRVFLQPGREPSDMSLLAAMVALASAFVLFHTSKGLILGTYFVEGARKRGVVFAVALEAPFGALALTSRFVGGEFAPVVALMLLYSAAAYYMTWHVFFPRRIPRALDQALGEARKRERRLAIAKRRK